MVGSLVYNTKVLCYRVVNLCLLSDDFNVPCHIFSLHLCYHRVAPLNLKYLVSNLIELFYLTPSDQVGKVLYVFDIIELLCYSKFLLFFMYLIACSV